MSSKGLVLHIALEMIQQKYTVVDIEKFLENIQPFWALESNKMIFRHANEDTLNILRDEAVKK